MKWIWGRQKSEWEVVAKEAIDQAKKFLRLYELAKERGELYLRSLEVATSLIENADPDDPEWTSMRDAWRECMIEFRKLRGD